MLCYRSYTSRKNLSLVRKTFLICERHISARNVQRIAITPHKIFIKALKWYISISHSPSFDIERGVLGLTIANIYHDKGEYYMVSIHKSVLGNQILQTMEQGSYKIVA